MQVSSSRIPRHLVTSIHERPPHLQGAPALQQLPARYLFRPLPVLLVHSSVYSSLQSQACAVSSLVLLASTTAALAAPAVVQLEQWGCNSVRVRIASPYAGAIEEPLHSALLPEAPACASQASAAASGSSMSSGSLSVYHNTSSGLVLAYLAGRETPLLAMTALVWSAPAPRSRPGSASVSVEFAGVDVGHNERIFGGGHWGDRLEVRRRLPFRGSVERAEFYGERRGKTRRALTTFHTTANARLPPAQMPAPRRRYSPTTGIFPVWIFPV